MTAIVEEVTRLPAEIRVCITAHQVFVFAVVQVMWDWKTAATTNTWTDHAGQTSQHLKEQ